MSHEPQGLPCLVESELLCSTARAVGLRCDSSGRGDWVGLEATQWALLVVMLVFAQGLTWRKAGKEARGWASAHVGSWQPSPTTCSHDWTQTPEAEVPQGRAGGRLRRLWR